MSVSSAYIICGTPRCGSNLLCQSLADTGVAGLPGEHFRGIPFVGGVEHIDRTIERFTGANGVYGARVSWMMFERLARVLVQHADVRTQRAVHLSYGAVLRERMRLSGARLASTSRAVAEPVLHKVLPPTTMQTVQHKWRSAIQSKPLVVGSLPSSSVHAVLMEHFPRLTYVFQERKDKLRQAISLDRARQSNVWQNLETVDPRGLEYLQIASHKWKKTAPPPRPNRRVGTEPVYSRKGIEDALRSLASWNASWHQYFDGLGIEPHVVTYEALTADREQTVRSMLEYLEIPMPEKIEVKPPLIKKLSGKDSDDWYRRYQAGE
jgi:LPS sulfotransferase NodH